VSRQATSFILAYHGCELSVAKRAVNEGVDILMSEREYDWLGSGAYFWESDPQRATEWAAWKKHRDAYSDTAIIGAVIDLGNCLDLTNREDIFMIKGAYASFVLSQQASGKELPENKSGIGDANQDRVLRYLDCAVINHMHNAIAEDANAMPFDTVRGMFTEGGEVYPGCGFKEKTHVQIAVRNTACIKGLFFPRNIDASS
jgi:hypothetical protein